MFFNEANFKSQIFNSNILHFDELAVSLFQYQYENNEVYRGYCKHLHIDNTKVNKITKIPFLPVSFFKTHILKTGEFNPEIVFTSSTTSGSIPSKHYVKQELLYEKSFLTAFELFYGKPSDYTILALLPSYLERDGSSLIVMADKLIKLSNKPHSGFYLHNLQQLYETLLLLEKEQTPVLLLGVTFALVDFVEQFPLKLTQTTIMETGGMKGRRKELVRTELHQLLTQKFDVPTIHSEYGMTELLSQAYSKQDGIYTCPPWMKIILTDANDPLTQLPANSTGLINIIDLANIHSCAFIQTSDIGKIHQNESFEVLGRMDQSDVRGCSLMYF